MSEIVELQGQSQLEQESGKARPAPPPTSHLGRAASWLAPCLGGEVLDGWEQPDKFLTPEHEAFLTR